MPDDLRLETNFEHYISRKLNELSDSGWQISENDNGFDADTALYMDDFISYIESQGASEEALKVMSDAYALFIKGDN